MYTFYGGLIYDENNLIRCEDRLKQVPLRYYTKTPYFGLLKNGQVLIQKNFM